MKHLLLLTLMLLSSMTMTAQNDGGTGKDRPALLPCANVNYK